ncbi:phage terminase large subunit, partial [Klebsiella pneumoniae]
VESIRGSLDVPDFFKQITVTFNPWNERHWLKRVFFDEETSRADTFATTTTYKCNEWLDEVDIKRYEDLYHTNQGVRESFVMVNGELLKV